MITFQNLVFILRNDDVWQARVNFNNGYGISVIQGDLYYCDENTYEVAVVKENHLCYDTPITGDVLGYQTPEDIDRVMAELQSYERNQY